MPTIHRVQAGTLAASVCGPYRPPNATDFAAVQRAAIPQSTLRPGYTGIGPGSKVKTPGVYAAAKTWGFHYPGTRRHTSR